MSRQSLFLLYGRIIRGAMKRYSARDAFPHNRPKSLLKKYLKNIAQVLKKCVTNFFICVILIKSHDPLAQLGERLGDNQKVTGSSPVWVTSRKNPVTDEFIRLQGSFSFCFLNLSEQRVPKCFHCSLLFLLTVYECSAAIRPRLSLRLSAAAAAAPPGTPRWEIPCTPAPGRPGTRTFRT